MAKIPIWKGIILEIHSPDSTKQYTKTVQKGSRADDPGKVTYFWPMYIQFS